MDVGLFLELAFDRGSAFLHLDSARSSALAAQAALTARQAAQAALQAAQQQQEQEARFMRDVVVIPQTASDASQQQQPPSNAPSLKSIPSEASAPSALSSPTAALSRTAAPHSIPAVDTNTTSLEVVGSELLAKLQFYSSRGPRWGHASHQIAAGAGMSASPSLANAQAAADASTPSAAAAAARRNHEAAGPRPSSAQQLLAWGGALGGSSLVVAPVPPPSAAAVDPLASPANFTEIHDHFLARRALAQRLRRAEELDRRKLQHASRVLEFQKAKAARERDEREAKRKAEGTGTEEEEAEKARVAAAEAATAAAETAAAASGPTPEQLLLESAANLDFKSTFGVHFPLLPFEKSMLRERWLAFQSIVAAQTSRIRAKVWERHCEHTRKLMTKEKREQRRAQRRSMEEEEAKYKSTPTTDGASNAAAASAGLPRLIEESASAALDESNDGEGDLGELEEEIDLDDAEVEQHARATIPRLEDMLLALPVPLSVVAPTAPPPPPPPPSDSMMARALAATSSSVPPPQPLQTTRPISPITAVTSAGGAAAVPSIPLVHSKALLPFSLQGDPSFYSDSALDARASLRSNPRILKLLDLFWRAFSDKDAKHGLVRAQYLEVHQKMQRALLRDQANNPAWVEAERERAEKIAKAKQKQREQAASAAAMAGSSLSSADSSIPGSMQLSPAEPTPRSLVGDAASSGRAGSANRRSSGGSGGPPLLGRAGSIVPKGTRRSLVDGGGVMPAAVAISSTASAASAAPAAIPAEDSINEEKMLDPLSSVPSALRPLPPLPRSAFDPAESLALATRDWGRDTRRGGSSTSGGMSGAASSGMKFRAFADSLFELVDLWTETTDVAEYSEFLSVLYQRITKQAVSSNAPAGSSSALKPKPGLSAKTGLASAASYARWRSLGEIPFEGWGVEDIWARFLEKQKQVEARRIRALLVKKHQEELAAARAARLARGAAADASEAEWDDLIDGDYLPELDEEYYSDEDEAVTNARKAAAQARKASAQRKRALAQANAAAAAAAAATAASGGEDGTDAAGSPTSSAVRHHVSSKSMGDALLSSASSKDSAVGGKKQHRRAKTKVERVQRRGHQRKSSSTVGDASDAATNLPEAGMRQITIIDPVTGLKTLVQVPMSELHHSASSHAMLDAADTMDDAADPAAAAGDGSVIPEGDERFELVSSYVIDHVDAETGEPVYVKRTRRVLVDAHGHGSGKSQTGGEVPEADGVVRASSAARSPSAQARRDALVAAATAALMDGEGSSVAGARARKGSIIGARPLHRTKIVGPSGERSPVISGRSKVQRIERKHTRAAQDAANAKKALSAAAAAEAAEAELNARIDAEIDAALEAERALSRRASGRASIFVPGSNSSSRSMSRTVSPPPPPVDPDACPANLLELTLRPFRRLVAESRAEWLLRLQTHHGFEPSSCTIPARDPHTGAHIRRELLPDHERWAIDLERNLWLEQRGKDDPDAPADQVALRKLEFIADGLLAAAKRAEAKNALSPTAGPTKPADPSQPTLDPIDDAADAEVAAVHAAADAAFGPDPAPAEAASSSSQARARKQSVLVSPRAPMDPRVHAQLQRMGLGGTRMSVAIAGTAAHALKQLAAGDDEDDAELEGYGNDEEDDAEHVEARKARKAAKREKRRAKKAAKLARTAAAEQAAAGLGTASGAEAKTEHTLFTHLAREMALKQWGKDQRQQATGSAPGAVGSGDATAMPPQPAYEVAPLAQRTATASRNKQRPSISAGGGDPSKRRGSAFGGSSASPIRRASVLDPELLKGSAAEGDWKAAPRAKGAYTFAAPAAPFRKYSTILAAGPLVLSGGGSGGGNGSSSKRGSVTGLGGASVSLAAVYAAAESSHTEGDEDRVDSDDDEAAESGDDAAKELLQDRSDSESDSISDSEVSSSDSESTSHNGEPEAQPLDAAAAPAVDTNSSGNQQPARRALKPSTTHHHPLDAPGRQFDFDSHALHWGKPAGEREALERKALEEQARANEELKAGVALATESLREAATASVQQRPRQMSMINAQNARRKHSVSASGPRRRSLTSLALHSAMLAPPAPSTTQQGASRYTPQPHQQLHRPSHHSTSTTPLPQEPLPQFPELQQQQQSHAHAPLPVRAHRTAAAARPTPPAATTLAAAPLVVAPSSAYQPSAPTSLPSGAVPTATAVEDAAPELPAAPAITTKRSKTKKDRTKQFPRATVSHRARKAKSKAESLPLERTSAWAAMDSDLQSLAHAAAASVDAVDEGIEPTSDGVPQQKKPQKAFQVVSDPVALQALVERDAQEVEWAEVMEQRNLIQMEAVAREEMETKATKAAKAQQPQLGPRVVSLLGADLSSSDDDGDSDSSDYSDLSSSEESATGGIRAAASSKPLAPRERYPALKQQQRRPVVAMAPLGIASPEAPVRVQHAPAPHVSPTIRATHIRFPSLNAAQVAQSQADTQRGWSHQLAQGLIGHTLSSARLETKEPEDDDEGESDDSDGSDSDGSEALGWKHDDSEESLPSSRRASMKRSPPRAKAPAATTKTTIIAPSFVHHPPASSHRAHLASLSTTAAAAPPLALESKEYEVSRHAEAAVVPGLNLPAPGHGHRREALFRNSWDVSGKPGPERDWIGRMVDATGRGYHSARTAAVPPPVFEGGGSSAWPLQHPYTARFGVAGSSVPLKPLAFSLDSDGSLRDETASEADQRDLARLHKVARMRELKRSKLLSTAYLSPAAAAHNPSMLHHSQTQGVGFDFSIGRQPVPPHSPPRGAHQRGRAHATSGAATAREASPPRIVPAYPATLRSPAYDHPSKPPRSSAAPALSSAASVAAALSAATRFSLPSTSAAASGPLRVEDPLQSTRFRRFLRGMERLVEKQEELARQRKQIENQFKVGPTTVQDALRERAPIAQQRQ